MPAAKVQMQYEEFGGVQNRIQRQLETVNQMINTVLQHVETLQNGAWIGRGAEAFYAEMQDLVFPGTQKLCQGLDQAITAARDVAARFQAAETEAGNLFKRS